MPDDLARSPISAEDLAISLAVRQDLGREHDDAVVAEFLSRVGPAIDARVDAQVAETRPRGGTASSNSGASTALAFVSLGVGIPISGIALGTTDGSATGLVALAISWAGIAAVNVAHNRGRR